MSYSGKFKDKNNNLHPVTSVLYGTCDTAAATAAKVVTCSDFDTLMTGVTIRVKFANANTAASPTVNINSTGAKSVYRFGSTAPVDGNSWNAGEVVELVYDGTSFFMTGADDLSVKQNVTDNSLQTTDKTVVGAINEHEGDIDSLKSGLTNLSEEVNGDATTYPYADVITIEDAVPANLADCSVKIEPVQDLHGYDHPWVGGAGKNKLGILLSSIISGNNHGTWNNNVYTYDNMVFTISTNSEGYIIGMQCVGSTGENAAILYFPNMAIAQESILNGCPSGGSSSTYGIQIHETGASWYLDTGNGATLPSGNYDTFSIIIRPNQSNVNLMFYPMIRLATETDATFAPYTNICPITGHTEVDVHVERPNLLADADWVDDHYITQDGSIGTMEGMYRYTNNYIGVSENTLYAIHEHQNAVTNLAMAVAYYDSNKTFIKRDIVVETTGAGDYTAQFTTPVNCQYARVNVALQSNDVMMQEGVFGHKTYTIALGSTIYGGTVDFDSGVMTVDRKLVDLGDYTWAPSGDNFYTSEITDFAYNMSDVGAIKRCPYFISDKYASSSTTPNIDLFFNSGYSGYRCFINGDTNASGMTGAEFKEYITGTHLCYELATPTTIQLTPQQIQLLKGTNTLTASTGQISVTANGVSGAIGQVQEQVNAVENGLIVDKSQSTGPVDVDGTFQIGANVLSHNIIIVGMHRYAYGASVVLQKEVLEAGLYANGCGIYVDRSTYVNFTVTNTGLLTIKERAAGWGPVNILTYGIL